jgi:hypothetical protein
MNCLGFGDHVKRSVDGSTNDVLKKEPSTKKRCLEDSFFAKCTIDEEDFCEKKPNSCYAAFAHSTDEDSRLSFGIGRVTRCPTQPNKFMIKYMMGPTNSSIDPLDGRYRREEPETRQQLVHEDHIILLEGVRFFKGQYNSFCIERC